MKAKKVLAILMASAMIMGTSVTAFAATEGDDGIYGTQDDRGTITVSGITYEAGITVKAYPIIEADYTNGTFSGYVTDYKGIIDLTPDKDKNINVTQAQMNQILKKIAEIEDPKEGTDYYSLTDDDQDNTYVSGTNALPIGSYLVVIEGAETKVYNPVVASIGYKNKDGVNALDEKDLDITTFVDDGKSWVKVTEVPGVDKVIVEDDDNEVKGNSVNIGDSVDYKVTIDPIPNYGGDYPELNVVDQLSTGLTLDTNADEIEEGELQQDPSLLDAVTVKVIDDSTDTEQVLVEGTDYTEKIDGQTITVDFVVNNAYTLNAYYGKKVVIEYSATVNDQAAINANANNNSVDLNYSKDSKTDGNDGKVNDKTYTYTFDIDGETTKKIVTKTGEDKSQPLSGAEFKLYTDKDCTVKYSNPEYDELLQDGNLVSNAEGQLYMKGLEEGEYWLKEVKAPTDYSVNEHVYKIEIAAEYYANGEQEGKLKSWTIKVDGTTTTTFSVSHDTDTPSVSGSVNETIIKNTKLSTLPSTGGIGTTIFTIGGCAIMVTAAGLYFATRKKTEK